ncbi:MAG: ATP synthase F0 subunit C [Bacteroidales bacterium]|jgi:F-type H+-transporting ATPase subunit c|nr:ATP synthase F0 subunit C [Bacteroidales bacterium]MBQ5688992.1 ATP synthase F0 subunit C [Bacteroidales bacterium]MBR0324065.1 ATP synthase F0 subunit C [Bacteroidales bacterium]MBR5215102.1 ATP synthase F0 subunit C [Bacteroidales bacterium]
MTLLVLLQEVVQAVVDLAPLAQLGAALAASIVTIGAALGISRIGSSALEATARQPEIAGNAQTSMIISAALVEGVSFFALVVCLLIAL